MTPQRATQAMTARIATQAEAEAGTDATQFMTPERAAQALVAQAPASAQIMTFSADSELTITPNVVDGIYRITGMLYGSVNNLVLLQTSDDGGTNYTDTSGDVFNCWRYYVYGNAPGSISSSYSGTAPGFYLDVSASSTAFRFDTFSAVLAFNGVDRVSVLSTACEFSGAGNIITTDVAGTTGGNHDSGIDRIRITTDTGTLTGTVIVENLRLS
jgi:hypothetical protein